MEEKSIGKNEDRGNERPLVSICCLAFNHEPYIREALEGFLMQKTDFPIEVLIHDDASTDGTASIIREYEERFPDIIKPIYQTENQYSKGIKNISGIFNFPRAKGKYIAMCEGDDYWTDPYKLQKQIDFLDPVFSQCEDRDGRQDGDRWAHEAIFLRQESEPGGDYRQAFRLCHVFHGLSGQDHAKSAGLLSELSHW